MAVHEARHDDVAGGVDFAGVAGLGEAFNAAGGAGGSDEAVVDQHRAAVYDAEVAERSAAAGTAAQREQLASAANEGRHSLMGIRRPAWRANRCAPSYPASTCRTTPMPGSQVMTRSRARAATGVPSATVTCPACSE